MAYTGMDEELQRRISIALAREYWIQPNRNTIQFTASEETQTLSLFNLGLMDIDLTNFELNGSGFSIEPVSTPVTIPFKNKGSIDVTFTGTEPGNYSSQLIISSTDPVRPEIVIELEGTSAVQ